MRFHVAIVVSLASVLGASCVQSGGSSSEMQGAGGALVETHDDGDIGGEPPIDIGASPPAPSVPLPSTPPGESWGEPENGGNFTYYACMSVRNRSRTVRTVFCGGLSTSQLRAVCYSHLYDSPEKWQNYCYDAFYNE